jgi:hypothetical protein
MRPPQPVESNYPFSFRKDDATNLGMHLLLRHSVELVGVKRVGISNFLRFFLYHPKIVETYISKDQKHIFIPVDLNDLVEREIQPFWILTLKRLVDVSERYNLSTTTKEKISALFLQSIQLQDNFFTIENTKKALLLMIEENFIPTLFFLRFDRMKESATPEFFNNIQGLINATLNQLAVVFTSDRSLDQIRPDVFSREELTTFCHVMYLLPAKGDDASIMLQTVQQKYSDLYSKDLQNEIVSLSGGHMQYLNLIHTILYEKHIKSSLSSDLLSEVINDERITLQSEEIFEALTSIEKSYLKKFVFNPNKPESREVKYVFDSGIIQNNALFSPLFKLFLQTKTSSVSTTDFSKKEHALFTLLKKQIGEICERDYIIHHVWPESEYIGVSDWTIDRLVARLRQKLTAQKSEYSITTIKTRGYKLVIS